MRRFCIIIRDGKIVDRAELNIHAKDQDHAESIAEELCQFMDSSAYVDSVYEIA